MFLYSCCVNRIQNIDKALKRSSAQNAKNRAHFNFCFNFCLNPEILIIQIYLSGRVQFNHGAAQTHFETINWYIYFFGILYIFIQPNRTTTPQDISHFYSHTHTQPHTTSKILSQLSKMNILPTVK